MSKYYNNFKLDNNQLFDILLKEYFYLQETVDKYDAKAITIKSWSITFSLVIFGSSILNNSNDLILLCSISAILFWIVETYWKVFQSSFYQRIWDIEKFLQMNEISRFRIPNVTGSFTAEFKKSLKSNYWSIMFNPQVMLPHFLIGIISLLIWLASII